jgi:hypothetical protein
VRPLIEVRRVGVRRETIGGGELGFPRAALKMGVGDGVGEL